MITVATRVELDALLPDAVPYGDLTTDALGIGDVRPIIAAAGGINAGNAPAYAASGADVLVTSSPYTARPRDVQVEIARA